MNISVSSGYWRLSLNSSSILCPFAEACIGGWGSGDILCDDSFEGNLCATPRSAYEFIDLSSQELLSCSVADASAAFLLAAVALVGWLALICTIGRPYDRSSTSLSSTTLPTLFQSNSRKFKRSISRSTSHTSSRQGDIESNQDISSPTTILEQSRSLRWLVLLKLLAGHLQVGG